MGRTHSPAASIGGPRVGHTSGRVDRRRSWKRKAGSDSAATLGDALS